MDNNYFYEEINHIYDFINNIEFNKSIHELEILMKKDINEFKFNKLFNYFIKNNKYSKKEESRSLDIFIKKNINNSSEFNNIRFTLNADKKNSNNSAKLFSQTGHIRDYEINYKNKIDSLILEDIELKLNLKEEVNLEKINSIEKHLISDGIKKAYNNYQDFLLLDLDEHKNLYKVFRIKERKSFIFNDLGVKAEITKVLSSKKKNNSMIYVTNIVNSGIKDNKPEFEYEIEVIDFEKFKDNLKNVVEEIYIESINFMNNTPFYCKINEKKYILDMFHDNFPIHINRVPNVKSFEIKHLNLIKNNDYSVTNKADGLGLFMLKIGYYNDQYSNNVYLIDYVNRNVIRYFNCGKSLNNHTILHGEFINTEENNYNFGIIDSYLYDGVNLTEKQLIKTSMDLDIYIQDENWANQNLDTRLEFANRFVAVDEDNYESIKLSKKNIFLKKFVIPDDKFDLNIFNANKAIINFSKNLKYENDGIIFTHSKKKIIDIGAESDTPILKWKPPNLNSIDFVIKFSKIKKYFSNSRFILSNEDIQINGILYRKVYFYNGTRGGKLHQFTLHKNDHALIKIKDNKIYDINNDEIKDNTIVEVVYDKDFSEDTNLNWKILRTRYDKTEKYYSSNFTKKAGNNSSIAYLIWKTIIHPVSEDVIIGNSYWVGSDRHSKKDTMKDMRFFHSLVKQDLIEKTIDRLDTNEINILDLGCGKYGILNRLIDINTHYKKKNIIKTVYGIDLYDDSINNPSNGAKHRFQMKLKQTSHCPRNTKFFVADLGEKLLAGVNNSLKNIKFNLIISMFTLHYFHKNENSLTNFLETVSNNLSPGGYFIGICFEGKKVNKLLRNKNKGDSIDTESWSIKKMFNKNNNVGSEIEISLESGIFNQTEWLVNFKHIQNKLEKMKLHLVDINDVDDNLLNYITNKYNKNINLGKNEKKYSYLNSTFVFRKSKLVIRKKLRSNEINKFNKLYELCMKYFKMSSDKEFDKKIANKTINKSLEYLDQEKFNEVPEYNKKIKNLKKQYDEIF